MKKLSIISLLTLILFAFNCAEFKKKKDNDTSGLALLVLAGSTACPTSSVSSPSNGTSFDFTQCSGDAAAALKIAGFTVSNVVLSGGVVGTGTSSTIVADSSRLSNFGGEKKATIQLTYNLSASDSYLEVVMPSTTSLVGPTFQLTPTEIKKKNALGATSALGGTPGLWASSLAQDKTLCIEVHNENGAHMFGWQGACANVNRGSYEFQEESVSGYDFSGDRVSFRLNKVNLKSVIIYSSTIGTAGLVRSSN
ncbi:hypothetical protein [Leptospira ilyithenensis]|uniref:Lipoprotein n=1 Tax=Leptospira ilyithenensis TaxID=2484901 RepID=A0A4R9LQ29_9LEPT|nr:hypothetical protein [Leptospira ilyithenensis]TGN10086.1 hypothetical protein EHS11_11035 [Leptospira ilyithenensis]